MRRLNPASSTRNRGKVRSSTQRPAIPWRRVASGTLRHGWPLAVLAGLGGGAYAKQDWLSLQWTALTDSALSLSAEMGFALKDVTVEGRQETEIAALLQALDVTHGQSTLMMDVAELQRRVETLPWVRHAQIERRLPDTIAIRLEERRVIAIWKEKDSYYLVGDDGTAIPDTDPQRFGPLLLVAGEDAPQHVAELQRILALEPRLATRVRTALWVGQRRWNLRLDNGINLQLPEENMAEAWQRLAKLDSEQNLLSRAITTIDLRLADRVVVKTLPSPSVKDSDDGADKTNDT